MTDVLLAHSYFLKYDPKQQEKMKPYPPLATLYAASLLRSAGYSVALFDAMLSDGEHEFEDALLEHRPRFVAMYEDSFNFLVKMCLSRMRQSALTMCEAARLVGATVIAASPDVSDHPEEYFCGGVHYAIMGEADHTLRELLDTLTGRTERSKEDIAGLAWPDRTAPGGIVRTAERKPERHLDVFPLPAWDLLDGERYRNAWRNAHGYYSVNMVTTRGCPFHCNWCAKPIWGQRYAMRSPKSVAEELAMVRALLQPDHIWFTDDIFGLKPGWVAEFSREARKLDAITPFTIQSRVDLMTDATVNALKEAGCEEVWLGAESGSQKILDAMDKGTEVSEIAAGRARLKAAGVKASFFLQFGYPGETFEDIMATIKMVRNALPDNIGVSVSYPLPGTKFYDMVSEQLGPKTHWTDSNDLAMMFQGTYQSRFYRHLHRVVHLDLEFHQLLAAREDGMDIDQGTDIALLKEKLDSAWAELDRLNVEAKSVEPTRVTHHGIQLLSPDLTREWN